MAKPTEQQIKEFLGKKLRLHERELVKFFQENLIIGYGYHDLESKISSILEIEENG